MDYLDVLEMEDEGDVQPDVEGEASAELPTEAAAAVR
jgi:hypothetical protein